MVSALLIILNELRCFIEFEKLKNQNVWRKDVYYRFSNTSDIVVYICAFLSARSTQAAQAVCDNQKASGRSQPLVFFGYFAVELTGASPGKVKFFYGVKFPLACPGYNYH